MAFLLLLYLVSPVLSDSCSYLYGFSPLLSKALFLLFDRAISASVCSFLIPFLLEDSRNEAGSWLTLMDVCWHWLSCCQPLTVQFSFQFDLRENGWFWLAFRREWVRLFDNEWGLPIGSVCHVIFLSFFLFGHRKVNDWHRFSLFFFLGCSPFKVVNLSLNLFLLIFFRFSF